MLKDLLSTADAGDCLVLIHLDLSASFDTVDHTILIDCLKRVGGYLWVSTEFSHTIPLKSMLCLNRRFLSYHSR